MKSCVFHPVALCVLLGVCGCAEAITDKRLASEVLETAFPSWAQISSGSPSIDRVYGLGRRSEAVEDCAKQAEALDNLDQYGSSAAERRWHEQCEHRYSCDPFIVQRYANPRRDWQEEEEEAKRKHVYYRTLFKGLADSCHLDVFPSDVTICNRRSKGDTIYYDASLREESYACSFTSKEGDGFGSCVPQQNRTKVCPEQFRPSPLIQSKSWLDFLR